MSLLQKTWARPKPRSAGLCRQFLIHMVQETMANSRHAEL